MNQFFTSLRFQKYLVGSFCDLLEELEEFFAKITLQIRKNAFSCF